jgi:hypothetical protein
MVKEILMAMQVLMYALIALGAVAVIGVGTMMVKKRPGWHTPTSRGTSIAIALASALGIIWFMGFRASWNPANGATELFWVRTFLLFAANALIQQWTLAYETGRGDEFIASIDKFVALAPIAAFGGCEILELGRYMGEHGNAAFQLNWRHHLIGGSWALYAVADFFATDITNQRLRALQFAPARAA